MTHVIELPRVTRGAELRATSFNEADNSIECCWTTGATVRRMSWRDGAYDEELIVSPNAVRLERLNAGAPMLNTHSDWSLSDVLGAVVPGTARIEKGQGFARVALSKAPGDADIVQKIRDGIIRNISVGYIRHQIEKIEKDGETPIWRVVDWEPHEISAVPVPADAGSQFRSAGAGRDVPLFPCTVVGGDHSAARARLRMRALSVGLR
jgi:phage head maturation protease